MSRRIGFQVKVTARSDAADVVVASVTVKMINEPTRFLTFCAKGDPGGIQVPLLSRSC